MIVENRQYCQGVVSTAIGIWGCCLPSCFMQEHAGEQDQDAHPWERLHWQYTKAGMRTSFGDWWFRCSRDTWMHWGLWLWWTSPVPGMDTCWDFTCGSLQNGNPKKTTRPVYSFSHNHGSGKWLYLKGTVATIGGTHFWLPWLWEEV